MAVRKLNSENEVVPELVLVQGPVKMSCLGGEVIDEAMLLDGYDAHLRLLEDRPKTTAGTYRTHVKAFLRYLAFNYPSVALSEVTKLQVRAFFLHEANRGITPIARSTGLFALRSFYRFLIAEGLCEENPASLVTLPSPVRPRVEFYTDAEADAIIAWASSQPGLRWQVGRALLMTLRYTGLRLKEVVILRTEEVDLDARRICSWARVASPAWSRFPMFSRRCSANTSTSCGPSSRCPPTCSPTPAATGTSGAATALGHCTTWFSRPGPRRP